MCVTTVWLRKAWKHGQGKTFTNIHLCSCYGVWAEGPHTGHRAPTGVPASSGPSSTAPDVTLSTHKGCPESSVSTLESGFSASGSSSALKTFLYQDRCCATLTLALMHTKGDLGLLGTLVTGTRHTRKPELMSSSNLWSFPGNP